MLSGKRDSDPRPQPWQGCALPTELFPHLNPQGGASLSIADAKVLLFSEPAKLFALFFRKNTDFFCMAAGREAYTLCIYIPISEKYAQKRNARQAGSPPHKVVPTSLHLDRFFLLPMVFQDE